MAFRFVPTKVHGALDFVTAPALIAAPDVLGLDGGRASAVAPRAAGLGAALYSPLTDYELGVRRVLPMRAHLVLDAIGGTAIALAPWLSGSARQGVRHWLPHALVGATELGLSLVTRTESDDAKGRRLAAIARRGRERFGDLSVAGKAGVVIAGVAVGGALAYVGRRRVFQAAALAAEAVEEVADAVEDAADFVEDLAEDAAEAARAKAGEPPS